MQRAGPPKAFTAARWSFETVKKHSANTGFYSNTSILKESPTQKTTKSPGSPQPGKLNAAIVWPPKYDLLGIKVSATSYAEAVELVLAAAQKNEPAVISCHAVHAVVTASGRAELRDQVNTFQIVTPDGQPVRWALNSLYKTNLAERVYGPELMLRICHRAAQELAPVYLYGGSPQVVAALSRNLKNRYHDLVIAGAESPPFRPLSQSEKEATVRRINSSGAKIVFIGLGCPKQDYFAYEQRKQIQAVKVCVGAAFDLHAGAQTMAPRWMQKSGLEWAFRLGQEPGRLWRRYLFTNSTFVVKLLLQSGRRLVSGKF